MKNSKLGAGAASVLGAVMCAAALSGCTSSSTTAASGGASVTGSDTTSAAAGGSRQSTSTGTAAGGTSTGANSGGGTCTNAELKVTTTGDGAAGGHVAWIVVFTNSGSATCTVEGYPGAGVTDKAGQVVLNATRKTEGYMAGGYSSTTVIHLAPGAAASTVLEWGDAPANGQAPTSANCPGVDSGKVLITPPNTTQSTAFPAPEDLCTDLVVHPLVAGSSGRPAQ